MAQKHIAQGSVEKDLLGFLFGDSYHNAVAETGIGLLEMMTHMNEEKNVTFIFSTHDHRVMEYARRLIRIRDGRVEEDQVKKDRM